MRRNFGGKDVSKLKRELDYAIIFFVCIGVWYYLSSAKII
jgi:hypothetical protein